MKILFAAVLLLSPAFAVAEDFPTISDFFQQMEAASSIPTPSHSVDGQLILVKGGPASVEITCDLVNRPGDRARHVCAYRCDIWGIKLEPAERIAPGIGAPSRPDCYVRLVTPRP